MTLGDGIFWATVIVIGAFIGWQVGAALGGFLYEWWHRDG